MKPEESGMSRRSFLTTTGGLALGVGIAHLPGTAHAEVTALPPLPWWNPTNDPATDRRYYPTAGLDVEAVRKAAYCLNYLPPGGCGYAASQVLINALGDALAAQDPTMDNPWKALPSGLYAFASGGVVGWGTICGSLNGVLGVMDILGVHGALGNALIDYFCTAELPTDALDGWIPADDSGAWAAVPPPAATVANVSHSPLCHNSVSSWAATAGVPLWVTKDGKTVASPQKSNRCARLVADIVAKAVELMNDRCRVVGSVTPPAWTVPASYATCYTCHTKADMVPSEIGKMECQACHTVPRGHGSWKRYRSGR